jgi:hypothetical protein
MEEFFRFIQQSERGRDRLIQEARAIDDSVFPPSAPISEQSNKAPTGHTVCGVNAFRGDRIFS